MRPRDANAPVARGASVQANNYRSHEHTTDREVRARRRWLAWALLGGWLSVEYVADRVRKDIAGGRP